MTANLFGIHYYTLKGILYYSKLYKASLFLVKTVQFISNAAYYIGYDNNVLINI